MKLNNILPWGGELTQDQKNILKKKSKTEDWVDGSVGKLPAV